MTPSPRCAAFIKGYEKCRLKAYMPTPTDRPTLGWGSTGPDIKLGMTWIQEQADERFAADLAKFSTAVLRAISPASATQDQFDAMTSLAYNIGAAAFASSSVAANHKAGRFSTAALAFGLWNKQRNGTGKLVVLNGLTRRRAAEAAIYRGDA
jgi:GH24 family phage-related lysozyme (muramidase)